MEYAHLKPLLRNYYLSDRGFTWFASAESDGAYRYAVYLRDRGYTMALQPEAPPEAFATGHPAVQEHNISVAPLTHVLNMGTNLLTAAATEHNFAVVPLAHPLIKGHHHAKSQHQDTPPAPAPYWTLLLPSRPSTKGRSRPWPGA